ncbi:MAG TPA: hypothetical protein VG318_05495 [Actinomycetota bacterium]|nr:hypothetical protein [Actinomycetota bacterium]
MSELRDDEGLGIPFARALAAKDWATVRSLLSDDLDFRGMTPRQVWEASADELVPKVLRGAWFEDDEPINELVECETRHVGNVENVRYLFRVTYQEGPHLVEQQAYLRAEDGRIKWLRIMCSGGMPIPVST